MVNEGGDSIYSQKFRLRKLSDVRDIIATLFSNWRPLDQCKHLYEIITASKMRTVGLTILITIIFLAIFAPYLAPYELDDRDVPYQSPSNTHWLGTDDIGQDVFTQLIYSIRISLCVGFFAGLIAVIIGSIVGLLAGYYRGWISELLMSTTEIFIIMPSIPLIITLSAYLDPNICNEIIIIGVLSWTSVARAVHAKVLQVNEMEYIESTRLLGYSNVYIILRHICPNVNDIIGAKFCLAVASAILLETSISFLGLGDPTETSWGMMINYAFTGGGFANQMWWWYVPPGLMICLLTLGFVLLGFESSGDERVVVE